MNMRRQKNDQSLIGKKFFVSYKNFIPSFLNGEYFRIFYNINKDGKQKIHIDQIKCMMPELKDTNTIIQYLGNGIYKDLITGQTVIDYEPEDTAEASKFPIKISKANLLMTVSDFNINEKEKPYISYVIFKAKEQEIAKIYRYECKHGKANIKKVVLEYEKIEREKIGKKYAVNYNDIRSTNKEIKVHLSKYPYLSDKFTIVKYVGNGIYKDLTSGIFLTKKEITLKVVKNQGNANYYIDRQLQMLDQMPLAIDEENILYPSDEILEDIGKNTLPYTGEIIQNIEEEIYKIKEETRMQLENKIKKSKKQKSKQVKKQKIKFITRAKNKYKIL